MNAQHFAYICACVCLLLECVCVYMCWKWKQKSKHRIPIFAANTNNEWTVRLSVDVASDVLGLHATRARQSFFAYIFFFIMPALCQWPWLDWLCWLKALFWRGLHSFPMCNSRATQQCYVFFCIELWHIQRMRICAITLSVARMTCRHRHMQQAHLLICMCM